jgi:hypothetical protein
VLAVWASFYLDPRKQIPSEKHPYPLFIAYVCVSAMEQFATVRVLEVFPALQAGLLSVPRALLLALQARGADASLELGLAYTLGTAFIAYQERDSSEWDRAPLYYSPGRTPDEPQCDSGEHYNKQQPLPIVRPEVTTEPSKVSRRLLALVSFVPLALYLCRSAFPIASTATSSMDTDLGLPSFPHLRGQGIDASLDIVIAHYDESAEGVLKMLQPLLKLPIVQRRHVRTILYHKGKDRELGEKVASAIQADQIVFLPNTGREGGTYLQHILRNYNDSFPSAHAGSEGLVFHRRGRFWKHFSSSEATVTFSKGADDAVSTAIREAAGDYGGGGSWRPVGFADHTIFLQSHLAWHWIAEPRMSIFEDQSGYVSLAPYVRMDCGRDMQGNGEFIRAREIYVLFREEVRRRSGSVCSFS